MNIKKHFILITLLLSTNGICAKPLYSNTIAHKSNWHTLFKKYLPPMIISSIIGAGTGGFAKFIEKELKINQSPEFIIWLAAVWCAEYTVRNSIIASLQKDFDDCHIPYRPNSMYLSSWIASWITYVNV